MVEPAGQAGVHRRQLVGRLHLDELAARAVDDRLQIGAVELRAGQPDREHADMRAADDL